MIILDIHPWITLPRSFIYSMTAANLPWFPEIEIACLAQIPESNIFGILVHLCKDLFHTPHILYDIIIDIFVKIWSQLKLS